MSSHGRVPQGPHAPLEGTLDLTDRALDGAALDATLQALSPSVTALLVRGAPLGDEGARALAAHLGRAPSLARLELRVHGFTPEGASSLLEAVERHPSLRALSLDARLPSPHHERLVALLCLRGPRARPERPERPATPEPTPPRPPTDEELDGCIRVLRARLESPRPLDRGTPRDEAILTLAAALLRQDRARERRARRPHREALREARRARLERTGIRQERAARSQRSSPQDVPAPAHDEAPPPDALPVPRRCYVCKAPFQTLHHFYDGLCPPCAARSFEKRSASADLTGRVALVTGARVKVGFQVALKLLRAGATVLATTRFPRDAAARYAREPDFDAWRARLTLHRLDLRFVRDVERFTDLVQSLYTRLDVIVNNAAQTIARPPEFYTRELEAEASPRASLPEPVRALLADDAWVTPLPALPSRAPTDPRATPFPLGRLDEHGQQVDLREKNSWKLTLDEVSTTELLEVQMVNAVAPFLLNARLRGHLAKDQDRDKFIVNVSAVEGVFSRGFKGPWHPHTNMAKAALNMLTRTAAQDYARDRIFMNAVDTGWISDQNPEPLREKLASRGFAPPLDEVDAAARVCDPIFTGATTGAPTFGLYLKDFAPSPW